MKKAISFGILAIIALLAVTSVSAVVPNRAPYANGLAYGYASYGSHPVNPSIYGSYYPYATQPVRAGGWYGANSAFLIGLKPGMFDSPTMNAYNRNRMASSYYPRAGGWFGGHTGYYNLRPGTFVYGGGSTYSTPSYYFHGPM